MMKIITTLKKILKTSPVESGVVGIMVLTLAYFTLPANADATTNLSSFADETVALEVAAMQNASAPFGALPEADLRGASYTMTVQASAYTSRPEETDSTPFTTASNTTVRDGVLATNILPFGTRVKIPSLYGDKVFIVEDRMNTRYQKNIDIWMEDLTEARAFGRKTVAIEVYPLVK